MWLDRLLSVRPHLRQGNMCEDNSIAMGAKGKEWHSCRDVQEGDGQLLDQERVPQPANTQVEPPQYNRWPGSQVSEGTLQGRGSEQGAIEAVAGDLAGTAAVRRPRAAKAGRRRKTKDKARRKTKGGPEVLCQLMNAQAGHRQL